MSMWLSIAVTVLLVAVAYVILNRNITARTSQQAALDEIEREVGAILTELNAASERNVALIEDRIATLEHLIEEADRRITVLRRESERDREITYQRPAPRPTHAVEHSVPDTPDLSSDQARAEDVPARVQRLYLQGFPLERIASIVGRTLGEVELIISLREGADS